MSWQWKPGDVAVRQVGALKGLVVEGCSHKAHPSSAHWHYSNGGWNSLNSSSAHKPLVVIDPENRQQVERLRVACQGGAPGGYCYCCDGSVEGTQAALRSLVAPPKPDEPTGLNARAVTLGVQWAAIVTPEGRRWVTDGGVGVTWDQLIADHPDIEVQS